MADGRFRRAYVGIAGGSRPLTPRLVRETGRRTAVEVAEIVESSPAEEAGVRGGDLLVAIDGHPVEGVEDVQRLMTGDLVGRPVTLSVIRGERALELELVPAELSV